VAREVPRGGPVAAHLLALGASLLLPSAARGATPDESPGLAAFTATIDALAAHERSNGGWTFDAPAGERPHPFTLVMQMAEGVAAPLGLAHWDLLVVRSPGTPAAGLLLLAAHRLTGRAEYLEAARRTGDLLVAVQLGSGGWVSEQLAAIEPAPISPCAGTPRELVAAGALR
jgi:hypothetical protein